MIDYVVLVAECDKREQKTQEENYMFIATIVFLTYTI